jgi:hypothetical protein
MIHDNAAEEIKVKPNDRPPTGSFEIDLNGRSVTDYPLDSYHADLRLQLFEDAIPAVDEAKASGCQDNSVGGSAWLPPALGRTRRFRPRRG